MVKKKSEKQKDKKLPKEKVVAKKQKEIDKKGKKVVDSSVKVEKKSSTSKHEEGQGLGGLNFYFDAIGEIFSKTYLKAVVILLLPILPVFIAKNLFAGDFFYDKLGINVFSFWSIFLMIGLALFSFAVFLFGQVALLFLVRDYEKDLSFNELFHYAKRALVGVIFLHFSNALLSFVGFFMLFVPGLVVFSFLTFAKWIYITQEKGIVDSVFESFQLVKGHFVEVASRIAVFFIFSSIVKAVFSFLPPVGVWNDLVDATFLGWSFVLMIFEYVLYLELKDIKQKSDQKNSVSA